MEKKITITCSRTGKTAEVKPTAKGNPRPPAGWKNHEGKFYSPEGWKEMYVLRAVTIPAAGPEDISWKELREMLKTAFGQATSVSNWVMAELSRRDAVRLPGMEKLPPMDSKKAYLYPEARTVFPGVPTGTLVSILNSAGSKYRKARYDLIWRSAISLPSFRYPVPFPVSGQSWKARWGEDGRKAPLVDLALPGGRVTLRLRGGAEYRRQLRAFGKIVSGEAVKGELAVYEQRVSESSNRNGIKEKQGGENRTVSRIMIKMVAWLPRTEKTAPDPGKTMVLATGAESLLVARIDGREEPFFYHADHARRWIRENDTRMARLRDDLKMESRVNPKRKSMYSRMETWSRKHTRRMDSLCHEASAAIVNFAKRQRCEKILFDSSEKGFAPHFPWHKLSEYIAYKADGAGIELAAAAKETEKST